MLPTLISIGSFEFSSFGVVLALGFIVFAFVIWREARDKGLAEVQIFDHMLATTMLSFAGARVIYIATHWSLFSPQLLRTLVIWRFPGLSYIGAFLIGLMCFYIFAKSSKLPIAPLFDIYGKALPVVIFFISLAVFLDGTVTGRETSAFWGLPAVGVPGRRHPVGLYGMLLATLMGVVLTLTSRYMNIKKIHKLGFIGWLSLSLFGFLQLLLANTRTDLLYWVGVSVENLVAVLTISIPLGPLYVLVQGGKYMIALKNKLLNFVRKDRK